MKSKIYVFTILLMIFICRCQPPVETTERWSVFEISMEAEKSYENPYLEPVTEGVFTSPSGNEIKLKAFWDGGNLYKIRATFTEEGEWTYRISSTGGDPGLGKTGRVLVEPPKSGNHGFVRVDREYPYHFVYDDGRRYFMWGTTYYGLVSNARRGGRWKTAIDSAMVFGMNKARFSVLSGTSEMPPFELKEDRKWDADRINPEFWKAVDSVVLYALEKGFIADMIVYGSNLYGHGTTPEQDKTYGRYILSRYAAFPNVIWCIVNEWNYRYRDYGKEISYWNEMGQLFYDEDPWTMQDGQQRALTIHQQTRVDWQFGDVDWPSHACVQYGVRNKPGTPSDEWLVSRKKPFLRHGDEWGHYSITYNLGHGMPVVNDEYGYIGEPNDVSEPPYEKGLSPRFSREKHRNTMWGIALAGGYAAAGDKNEYEDGRPYRTADWHSDPPEYMDIKHLVDFFTVEGPEYWKMKSSQDILRSGERVYALAEEGRQYLFYTAAGEMITAEIPEGNYAVTLFNPRTAEKSTLEPSKGGVVAIEVPDEQDWVVFMVQD